MKRLILISLFIFSSCSLAPLTSPKTASSLGKGELELTGGLSPAANATLIYGLTEDLDFGGTYEIQFFQQVSVWGKYSFINQMQSHSLALYGGVFAALDASSTRGIFVGPVYSYRHKWFEHYLVTRYNYVNWGAGDIKQEDKEDSLLDLNWDSGHFSYLQFSYGINFWTSEKFAINISAQYFYYLDNDGDASNIVPGIELIFKN